MEKSDLAHELITGIQACQDRGLLHSSKWLSELLYALDDKNTNCIPTPQKCILNETSEVQMEDVSQDRTFILSKCYFDLKEYDRCAYFSKKLKSKKGKFLYWYSQYLSGEKKRIEDMSESEMTTENMNLQHLTELKQELSVAYKKIS
uniref:Cell division cycle protein 23 n=1 Tax=Artemia sinica TaxID=112780 RepID=A0A1B2JJF5_9CRUS|nr:cell division cycle protein 23 [Artemia sinica]